VIGLYGMGSVMVKAKAMNMEMEMLRWKLWLIVWIIDGSGGSGWAEVEQKVMGFEKVSKQEGSIEETSAEEMLLI
jgi:hypothetical protein